MQKIKVSKRIEEAISLCDDVPFFFDLCCDHGKLGISLLNKHSKSEVFFIDQIETITTNLATIIHSYIPKGGKYKILTENILKFKYSFSPKNIILIGIGTDLILKFLDYIELKKDDSIIICSHKNPLKLRLELKKRGFMSEEESLICENNQFYDFIKINSKGKKEILPIPDKGGLSNSKYLDYLSRLEKHLLQVSLNTEKDISSKLLDNIARKREKYLC